MKKVVFLGGIVLAGLYLLLSLLDTSDYKLERKLWYVGKQFEEIAKDPHVVPEKKYENLIAQYEAIAQQHPHAKLTPSIYIQVGRIYSMQGKWERAREAFGEILRRYSDDPILASQALLATGYSFEKEGKPDQAVATYRSIIEKYPLTDIGMSLPVYVANYFLRQNQPNSARRSRQEAIDHYQKIIALHPQSSHAFKALQMLATVYMADEQWEKAFHTFAQILLEYAQTDSLTPKNAFILVKTINTLAITQLHDYSRALRVYEEFLKKYPRHPLEKYLQDNIDNLKKLQMENVTIRPASP